MELYLTNAKKIKLESLENPNADEKKILDITNMMSHETYFVISG